MARSKTEAGVKLPKGKDASASKKANGTKVAAAAPAPVSKKAGKADKTKSKPKKEPTPESSSESEDDSESASSAESESEEEAKPAPKTNGHANGVNGSAKKQAAAASSDESASDDSSDDEDEEGDSSDESEEEPPKAKGAQPNGKVTKAAAAKADSDESDASEDDESSDDDEESDEETEAPSKKRKADETSEPAVKKAKTEAAGGGVKNLFVGNLTWSIDDEWLQREFSSFGECSARVMTGPDGRSKGFGFVEFETAEMATAAHDAMKGTELDGRALNVDYSTPRGEAADRGQKVQQRAQQFGDAKSTPTDTLWVGSISFNATAEMFQEAFGEFGSVTRVHLPTDPESGSLKGFGYVGMGSVEEATAAFEGMNGQRIDGRPIRLDYATPRSDNPAGGSRGGRGGFGGRGGGRGDFGGRGGGRGGRGGFGGRGGGRGRGAPRGRGGSTNRGGFGDFSGQKTAF